jgi:hypothetical protein
MGEETILWVFEKKGVKENTCTQGEGEKLRNEFHNLQALHFAKH